MSDSTPLKRRPRRLQFRLSYLLYLLTLAALGFTMLRRVLEIRGGRFFNTITIVILTAMIAYFAIRVPILVKRLMRHKREAALRRTELAKMVESLTAHRPTDRPPIE